MKGFRFTQYVPPQDPEKNIFENLLNIFLQLVTMTGGDVAEALRKVHDSFKHEEIVFISLSTDKNKELWLQSIRENAKRTKLNPWAGRSAARKGTVMLYTGGTGNENDFCRKYVPNRFYPKLLLIDPDGKVVDGEIPRPDRNPVAFMSYISGLL